jgi:aryl-alcohol dehydrogenase-like predicted oxidoreductase
MFRRRQSRFTDDNLAHNVAMLAALDAVVSETGATRAQVALAWCLHRPWDVLPIPGSSRLAHLRENAAAAEVRLTGAQVAKLDTAFAPGRPKGDGTAAAG